MELKDILLIGAKNTVGYAESKNKESFLVGVDVGFTLAKKEYESQIVALESRNKYLSNMHDKVANEIQTISDIITKYSK